MPAAPDLGEFRRQWEELLADSRRIAVEDVDARYELYHKACRLRRAIAFSNPLLDFDRIVFIKRRRAIYNHMCDQYYGAHAVPGGGVFVLSNPFGEKPKERDVLAGSVVERGRLIVLVHGVDRGDEDRLCREVVWLDQPQWHRTGSNQVPIRVGQQGA